MKKTILFLMNGFGIEQQDSYTVYDKKLTPFLDNLTKTELFAKLNTNTYDLKSSYRTFSTGSMEPLTSLLLDNYFEHISENNNFKLFTSSIKENSKLHIFLEFETEKNFNHIKAMVENIKKSKNIPIYLHLILTSNNYNDYKELERIISKLNYGLKDCKIGMIFGHNTLNSYIGITNMLENELGENWKDISKKLSALEKTKTKPIDVKEFYVNSGFKIDKQDSVLFFNYEFADLTNFVNKIKEKNYIEPYSMFGINGIKYTLMAYPKSGISLDSNLKNISANALILSNKENIKTINYYCNGLVEQISENISFSRTDNGLSPSKIKSIIKNSKYDLIIINFPIDDAKTITELKDKMKKLDSFLEVVCNFCKDENISLIVSSLFGIQKPLKIDNYANGDVDFMGSVPLIVIDKEYDKSLYSLESGTIYDLAMTVFKNINNKYNGKSLLRPKNSIEKMLKK